MFEPEVFRKQMYCTEERACDMLELFGARVIVSPFLRNVVVSGYVTFYQVKKTFVKIQLMFHYSQTLCGRMKWFPGP